jgi:hypothetical protein
MTTFKDRNKGFEQKFAHDEELKFRATARRNKLLGLWAADQLGLTGDEAQAYAREVIKADLASLVMKMWSARCGAISMPRASSNPTIRYAASLMR